MKGTLHVIGLGPAGLEQISLGNYRLLRTAAKVFVRTKEHPCAKELENEGINLESFDYLYNKASSFEEVYEGILETLRESLRDNQEVVYAVPGHPNVAEDTVQLILKHLAKDNRVQIHPALSFLDSLFTALGCDPIQGCLVRRHENLKEGGITGKDWLIIPQVYDRLVASELKLDLMRYYPDEAEVYIVSSLGLKDEAVRKTVLHELDHCDADHLTTVAIPPNPNTVSIEKLLAVMEVLRSPEGCPWDREQSHESLKPYVVEEAYEVINAINNQDMYNLSEELGDLLLQVVFHAQVASEGQEFDFQDVLKGIVDKLIRRHPHVFGNLSLANSEEVIQTWEEIKRKEKEEAGEEEAEPSVFKDAKSLPALILATKTQARAAKMGFDWDDMEGPFAKVYEELQELRDALKIGVGIKEEFGDVLFSIVNLSRFLKLDAEEALRGTIHKFQQRFLIMIKLIRAEGLDPNKLALDELDKFWNLAKLSLKNV